jgi:predicted nucleic acid-binding protein
MAGLTYLLDTVTVSALFAAGSSVQRRIPAAKSAGDQLMICQPTYYEILRGLLKVGASRKLQIFQQQLLPLFEWVELTDSDWTQAAQYWADATRKGRQLSDMDLLIAAVAARLDAVLVSADADFDALSIKREDWRTE